MWKAALVGAIALTTGTVFSVSAQAQSFAVDSYESHATAQRGPVITEGAIARHLKIPLGTVSRDLAAMRKSWRDFPVHDGENVRLEQLQKIDLIEAEAWAAWDRSQQQRRTAQMARSRRSVTSRVSPSVSACCQAASAVRKP